MILNPKMYQKITANNLLERMINKVNTFLSNFTNPSYTVIFA